MRWLILVALLALPAHANDDGRYANSKLKPWFDSLKSKLGPCCSDADGTALSDPDWEMTGGGYRVRIEGEWHAVPDDALLTQPNMDGRAIVWPMYRNGAVVVRCFIPGATG